MAGIAYVRKRLYNPEILVDPDEIFGENGWILKNEDAGGDLNPLYEITWTGATQAGAEELGTVKTNTKDGTTTPYLVNIVSADALDDRDNAAGTVHSVAIIGISTNSLAGYIAWQRKPKSAAGQAGKPRSTVEVIHTNGIADVLGTRYMIWTDAAYACEWGTGATNDAEGNIDVEAPTGTVQIRIPAGQNEGMGGQWHFPPGRGVHTEHATVNPTATFAAGDGCVLSGTFTSFDQANNAAPDLNVDYFTYTSDGGSVDQSSAIDVILRKTTINSSVVWAEALIANSIVYAIHLVQSMH